MTDKEIIELIRSQLEWNREKLKLNKTKRCITLKGLRFRNWILNQTLSQQKGNALRFSPSPEFEVYVGKSPLPQQVIDKLREKIINNFSEIITNGLKDNKTLQSTIYPAGEDFDEAPNYYIQNERFGYEFKLSLLQHISDCITAVGLGIYITEEAHVLLESLRRAFGAKEIQNIPIPYRSKYITPFERMFWILNRCFVEIYNNEQICEHVSIEVYIRNPQTGKISLHIFPDISRVYETFYATEKLYVENRAKLGEFFSSIMRDEEKLAKGNRKSLHLYISDIIHSIFTYNRIDLDSTIKLIDLKIKLLGNQPKKILYLNDILSLFMGEEFKKIEEWVWKLGKELKARDEENTLKRILMDLRTANSPQEFTRRLVNHCITLHTSGIETGVIPKELKHFDSISQFKSYYAMTLATLYNILISKQSDEKEKGGEK